MSNDVGTPGRTVDLGDLERVAAVASTQDRWQWRLNEFDGSLVLEGVDTGQVVMYAVDAEPGIIVSVGDQAFIEAASPPVVSALVARIRCLEHALLDASHALDPIDGDMPVEYRNFSTELLAIRARGTVLL
jgi:hypothetical protein